MANGKISMRLPYKAKIPGGLRNGEAVRVRGVVNDDALSFAISFNCDKDQNVIAAHISPRQYPEDFVINSWIRGWGEEERNYSWFPFKRGQFFDCFIVIDDDIFNIYVNDIFLTRHKLRVPARAIEFLYILGQVTLMDVEFIIPLDDTSVKAVTSVLEKDDLISVKRFSNKSNMFSVNLLNGMDFTSDIALFVKPRRDPEEVVLNNRKGGIWGEEEKHPSLTEIMEMVPFHVEILNEGHQFRIYINCRQMIIFQSRDDPGNILGIYAGGDRYIYEVKHLKKVDTRFVVRVRSPLETVSWISLTGVPHKNASIFAIDLQTGSDVPLQISVDFERELTVRKTQLEGEWLDEETDQPNFPFEQKKRFELFILVLADTYRIFVNRQRYVDHSHKMPPKDVLHLRLTGDCDFYEPTFY